MLRRFYFSGILALAMTASACARVEITRLAKANDYSEGIRFYRPAPYLVTSIEKDACTDRIVYLPDPEQEYLIRVHSGLGTVDAKATLENGWNLIALGEARDSKIPETITAVGGLLTALTPKAELRPGERTTEATCKPGIVKLTYDTERHAWGASK
jgi:nitrogen fixation protein